MLRIAVVGCGYPDIIYALEQLQDTGDICWEGWLDDNADLHGKRLFGKPVLGPVSTLSIDHTLHYVNTVALSASRRQSVETKLAPFKHRTASVIYPGVLTHRVAIGRGCVIGRGVHLEPRVILGDGVMVLPSSTVGHDCVIGENSFIGSGVNIGGGCEIGRYVWIGAGAVIHPKSRIGDYAVVSMGARVISRNRASHVKFYEDSTKVKI